MVERALEKDWTAVRRNDRWSSGFSCCESVMAQEELEKEGVSSVERQEEG